MLQPLRSASSADALAHGWPTLWVWQAMHLFAQCSVTLQMQRRTLLMQLQNLHCVRAKAGDAIVFHPSVLHGIERPRRRQGRQIIARDSVLDQCSRLKQPTSQSADSASTSERTGKKKGT